MVGTAIPNADGKNTARKRVTITHALTALAPLMFAFGAAHLVYQIWQHWNAPVLDFRFFWLAGDIWAQGETPYSETFARRAADEFGILVGAAWYYPPNWILPTALLSLFEPLTSSRLWLIINCLMLTAASALNVMVFRSLHRKSALFRFSSPVSQSLGGLHPALIFGLHFGFIAAMQATGNTLHLGQSSMLIYLGASLIAYGAVLRGSYSGAIGVAIVMLKPQIGILMVIALGVSAYGRRIIVLGAILSFLIAAPALLITPMPDILSAMATTTTQYNDHPYNLPAAMTGLTHILWALGDNASGAILYIFAGIVWICALTLITTLKPRVQTIDRVIIAAVVLLAATPLHIYDFTLLGVILLPVLRLRGAYSFISAAAIICIWRAGNLPQIESLTERAAVYYPGSLYVSIGAVLLLGCITMAVIRRRWSPQMMNLGHTRAQTQPATA